MRIVFIDDELERIKVYIEDLEISIKNSDDCLLDVKEIRDLDSAYEYVSENHDTIDLIILDIMMPGGNYFYNQEEDPLGVRSGFYFYQKIRELYPKLKIVIFTNITDDYMGESVEKDDYTKTYYKDELLPFEFTQEIMENYLLIEVIPYDTTRSR